MRDEPPAKLALEDGTVYAGRAIGATPRSSVAGEVVFNTAMTGYQEVLTDPSYAGQIVVMTAPHIGNYGINPEDVESSRIQVAGFVVRELAGRPSNFRAETSLDQWLARAGVPGIEGIDTRALTRRLRVGGAMRGALGGDGDDATLVGHAQQSPSMAGRNLADAVSPTERQAWTEPLGAWRPLQGEPPRSRTYRVVAMDCGAKANILRHLVDRGCEVYVVPGHSDPDAILDLEPDGLFVSNGPGDPEPVRATTETLRALQGKVPTFGICLGHQLLALALGARTFKLKFGHHGGNQPVQNLATEKVEITSQNHGFAVDTEELRARGGVPTHINLNDATLEGFSHRERPLFAVQYHPEAAPGPHDAAYLFDCFLEMMRSGAAPSPEAMDAAQRRRSTVTSEP